MDVCPSDAGAALTAATTGRCEACGAVGREVDEGVATGLVPGLEFGAVDAISTEIGLG